MKKKAFVLVMLCVMVLSMAANAETHGQQYYSGVVERQPVVPSNTSMGVIVLPGGEKLPTGKDIFGNDIILLPEPQPEPKEEEPVHIEKHIRVVVGPDQQEKVESVEYRFINKTTFPEPEIVTIHKDLEEETVTVSWNYPKKTITVTEPEKEEEEKEEYLLTDFFGHLIKPPKVDPPKVDPPKADPPKADPPKTEPPKVDPPKTEFFPIRRDIFGNIILPWKVNVQVPTSNITFNPFIYQGKLFVPVKNPLQLPLFTQFTLPAVK